MKTSTFEDLLEIMQTLRSENGCPWDKKQTHQSIQKYGLEEVYEIAEAIEEGCPNKLKDELGDLLFLIVFHCQIAKEQGDFQISDVITNICQKMTRRHPHVFSDVQIDNEQQIKDNWEAIKSQEPGYEQRTSVTDGIPKSLPALMKAQKIQKKVTRVGFNWTNADQMILKIEEELDELKQALKEQAEQNSLQEEIGDLLFSVVNLSRFCKLDAEESMLKAVQKFKKRFLYIENNIQEHCGKSLEQASLSEMQELWQKAKQHS